MKKLESIVYLESYSYIVKKFDSTIHIV